MRSAHDDLRRLVLHDAYLDRVELSRVDWHARRRSPGALPARWCRDVIEVIQSLVEDALVDVGHPTLDGGFVTLPLADCLRRLHEVYVARYGEPILWGWCIWLDLTVTGRAFASKAQQQAGLTVLGGGRALRRTNGHTKR
jgi:hypothetical protein